MIITERKWSEHYMRGVIDVALNKVNEEVIKDFAYFLQSEQISKHPDCILYYEDFLTDNRDIFEEYEAYTKGVIETAEKTYINKIENIFNQSVFDAVEDYEVEAKHLDENYSHLQGLLCVKFSKTTRIIFTAELLY